MTKLSNLINRQRMFVGGELGNDTADLLEEQAQEIESLKVKQAKKFAECKKDAERLDWLSKSNWYVGPSEFYCTEGGDLVEYDDKNDSNLRGNIDAAISQKEEA